VYLVRDHRCCSRVIVIESKRRDRSLVLSGCVTDEIEVAIVCVRTIAA
jgi:hypothetical protein